MAFDATVGGTAATSYLTVADADERATADIGPEADGWLKAATPIKEAALQRATRELDGYLRPGGYAYSEGVQRLLFPRFDDLDAVGVLVLPFGILQATYHQAAYVIANHRVIDAANARRAQAGGPATDPDTSYAVSEDGGPSILSPRAIYYLAAYQRTTGGATISSVVVGTGYSYPRAGYPSELLP